MEDDDGQERGNEGDEDVDKVDVFPGDELQRDDLADGQSNGEEPDQDDDEDEGRFPENSVGLERKREDDESNDGEERDRETGGDVGG